MRLIMTLDKGKNNNQMFFVFLVSNIPQKESVKYIYTRLFLDWLMKQWIAPYILVSGPQILSQWTAKFLVSSTKPWHTDPMLLFLLDINCFAILCFCCTTKWTSCMYTYILSLLDLPPTSPHSTNLGHCRVIPCFQFFFSIYSIK